MELKKPLRKLFCGWIPKEANLSIKGSKMPQASTKILRFSIIFGITALIIALTVVFYLPFIEQEVYGFVTVIVIVGINAVAAYLVHKQILPKPTIGERVRNLAILAVVAIVVMVVWLLIGGF